MKTAIERVERFVEACAMTPEDKAVCFAYPNSRTWVALNLGDLRELLALAKKAAKPKKKPARGRR